MVLWPAFHVQIELALLQSTLAIIQLAPQAPIQIALLKPRRQHQPETVTITGHHGFDDSFHGRVGAGIPAPAAQITPLRVIAQQCVVGTDPDLAAAILAHRGQPVHAVDPGTVLFDAAGLRIEAVQRAVAADRPDAAIAGGAGAQHEGIAQRARVVLQPRQHAADADLVADAGHVGVVRRRCRVAGVAGAPDHVLDHLHQPHLHAVVGVVDALHAVGLQFADLLRGDGAAATTEHADVAGAALAQHVHHVLEVLDMAALVGRQRDGVGVFLQRRADHVFHRAVVAQVDHFRALRLDQPAHDVDGRVMAVEQAGGGDETQRAGFRLRLREVGGRSTHGPCDISVSVETDDRAARRAGQVAAQRDPAAVPPRPRRRPPPRGWRQPEHARTAECFRMAARDPSPPRRSRIFVFWPTSCLQDHGRCRSNAHRSFHAFRNPRHFRP